MIRRLVMMSLVTLVVLVGALSAAPASACGCGAWVPRSGDAQVSRERALIRWDGTTEDIVMGVTVRENSREAAWIVPVPHRATVRLGNPNVFSSLRDLTRPKVINKVRFGREQYGAAPAAGEQSPVLVLERQALGPYDVTNLTATDSGALARWLGHNGYRMPVGLPAVLRPYVRKGWYYVAVKLRPGQGSNTLSGDLNPLRVTFKSNRIVYPMRATSLAHGSVGLLLYVLAKHRVNTPALMTELVTPTSEPVTYAGWVTPKAVGSKSPLRPFLSGRMFLTKFDIYIQRPSRINNDFVFSYLPGDKTFRELHYTYTYMNPWIFVAGAIVLVGLVGALFLLIRHLVNNRRHARQA